MDFKTTLKILVEEFEKKNISYALAGGFAMGIRGIYKATVDIDFLISADDVSRVHEIMTALGYDLVHSSENASQYVSAVKLFGEVDFLHARHEISREMVKDAEVSGIFGDEFKIKVLKTEDIIGLKVQAISNDPARTARDWTDIQALLEKHGKTVSWGKLAKYFRLFEKEKEFAKLKKKYE